MMENTIVIDKKILALAVMNLVLDIHDSRKYYSVETNEDSVVVYFYKPIPWWKPFGKPTREHYSTHTFDKIIESLLLR